MIYVLKEPETGGKDGDAKKRNLALDDDAKSAQFKNTQKFGTYGKIVNSPKEFRERLKEEDYTLYVFAHGNTLQCGPFKDPDNLRKHLGEKLEAFSPGKGGRYLRFIVLNACHSRSTANVIASSLRHCEFKDKYVYMKIIGTNNRAYTDPDTSCIRIAKDDKHADELDAFLKANPTPNANKLRLAFKKHCQEPNMGFTVFCVKL